MLRILRAATIGILVPISMEMPAFAHAHLVSSIPAADASLAAAPPALVLHFTERVEPGFTGVTLKDSGGLVVPTGATTSSSDDPTTITVPIAARLIAGRYLVAWHALAVDGHKTSGTYGFAVALKATTP